VVVCAATACCSALQCVAGALQCVAGALQCVALLKDRHT